MEPGKPRGRSCFPKHFTDAAVCRRHENYGKLLGIKDARDDYTCKGTYRCFKQAQKRMHRHRNMQHPHTHTHIYLQKHPCVYSHMYLCFLYIYMYNCRSICTSHTCMRAYRNEQDGQRCPLLPAASSCENAKAKLDQVGCAGKSEVGL